jgi:hypothetical protein
VADAGPRLSDRVGSLLRDLVVHDTGAEVLGSVAPGDVALAPGSSSAMGQGLSGLYLLGSPGSLPPPIN